MDKYIWNIVVKSLEKLGYDSWIYVNREIYMMYHNLPASTDVINKINIYYKKKYENINIQLTGPDGRPDGYSKIDYTTIPYISAYCINNDSYYDNYPPWIKGYPALRIRRIVPNYNHIDYLINSKINGNFSIISIKSDLPEKTFNGLDAILMSYRGQCWRFDGLYPFTPSFDEYYYMRSNYYMQSKTSIGFTAWLCYDEIIFPQLLAGDVVDNMIFIEMKDYKKVEELKKTYHTDKVELKDYKYYKYTNDGRTLSTNYMNKNDNQGYYNRW
jgi:hypothetical protein